jgi:PKD repeat protein
MGSDSMKYGKRRFLSLILCGAMVLLFIQLTPHENASATPSEDWVARYDGPDNTHDYGEIIIVDEFGNVYVTGPSYGGGGCVGECPGPLYDFATIMYNETGVEQWVTRYNGSEDRDDIPWDMVRDPNSGNLYVTGWSWGNITKRDIATVAYDGTGTELWVAIYDGQVNGNDSAYAMALDSSSGNIYVTGKSEGLSGDDLVTIAYSSSGTELWATTHGGSNIHFDPGSDIAVGPTGFVFVVSEADYDYRTIAYEPSTGSELWIATFTGPGGAFDIPSAMAIDPNSGNIYVTGSGYIDFSDNDFVTVAYDSTGNELWVAVYDGPGDGSDHAYDLVIDSAGHIYVTGDSMGAGTDFDYATVAYDNLGNELWVSRFDGPGSDWDRANAMTVDDYGNIYATGQCSGFLDTGNFCTVGYDSITGAEIGTMTYDGPINERDLSRDVTTDQNGFVYVTGYSRGLNTMSDFATAKYSFKRVPPTAIAGPDLVIAENELVNLDGTNSFDPDGTLISYSWDLDLGYDSSGDTIPDNDVDATGPSPSLAWWNDDYVSTVKLTVKDNDGNIATDTMTVTVENLDPSGDLNIAHNHAQGFVYDWTATDPGSDDLTVTLKIGSHAPIVEVYRNDGIGPDPNPSPYSGTGPFDVVGNGELPTSLPPGVYNANLTVQDDDGASYKITKSVTITNLPPDANFTFSPSDPEKNEIIQFVDTSTDPNGPISSWLWDFGDGTTSTIQHPTHAYPAIDTYTVTLKVWDGDGGTDTFSKIVVVINIAPDAEFSFTPDEAQIDEVVTFTDQSTDADGTIVSWEWDFGDGSTSTDQNPTHSYSEPGSYTVTLIVFDEQGDSDGVTKTIVVVNQPPEAGFTYLPKVPKAGETVSFTDESTDPDGSIVTWKWDFGDGTTSKETNPDHVYQSPGTYTVKLKVYDEYGDVSIFTQEITVDPADTGSDIPPDTIMDFPWWILILIGAIILILILFLILWKRRKKREEEMEEKKIQG